MEKEIVKAKSQRHKRVLKKREPKIHENDKRTLFIRGGNTSETVTTALKELYLLKKPNAILFRKRNVARPFEDYTTMEFLTKMNDASLFLFGSHSKKRPHNIVIGRTYDNQVLDMIELGIENYQSLRSVNGSKCSLGTKPCLIFSGSDFETDDELRRVKSVFTDFFRGPVVDNVRLSGLEHLIQFTAFEGKVFVRSYKVALKKSGSRTPRIELDEMGPNMDLLVRRTHLASDDLFKKACRKPKAAKPKKVKNVTTDVFGAKHGRVHMQKQELKNLQLRKVKALKRKLSTDDTKTKVLKK
ncbi:ribosome production factor 2 homolog [Clavelina lepadiformis]|uniref:ribosome production factor 2 homolog n=1 Tax=Clavelina lepadiformis TaxID=159417 RepID=UPI0040414DFD